MPFTTALLIPPVPLGGFAQSTQHLHENEDENKTVDAEPGIDMTEAHRDVVEPNEPDAEGRPQHKLFPYKWQQFVCICSTDCAASSCSRAYCHQHCLQLLALAFLILS